MTACDDLEHEVPKHREGRAHAATTSSSADAPTVLVDLADSTMIVGEAGSYGCILF